MPLTTAIQMDPIQSVDIDADSTFALALEGKARGHKLLYYEPKDLALHGDTLRARARDLDVRREKGNHFTLGVPRWLELSSCDVVLMRQDPPFDMGYITATHLLERIQEKTLVVNDPKEVRNAPEKLFVTHFAKFMPPTLITSDREAILAFRAEHKDIILKPLYGNGGAGVFRLRADDENLNALLEMFTRFYREPVIVQRYIPDVRKGDKRIILVNGKPVGALNRVPQEGEARANLHAGAKPEAAPLSKRDEEICAAIGPELRSRGLIFTGIDVIGGYLTEINVTSPTGIQEIKRLGGPDIAPMIWDAIEEKRRKSAA